MSLFKDNSLKENRVDIYYREEDAQFNSLIAFLDKEQSLIGTKEGVQKRLLLNEIYYLEAIEKKCFAYLQDEVYQVDEKLQSFEEKYARLGYVRVNKSTVLNILKIDHIKANINMRVMVWLENGECIVINRSYKQNFNDRLRELWQGGNNK